MKNISIININQPIWEGIFSNWDEAVNIANGEDGKSGFSNEKWIERIFDQVNQYREESKEFGIAMPPRQSNLPMVYSLIKPKKILDFGGSSGWTYEYLSKSIPKLNLKKYYLLELPKIIEFFKKSTNSQKKISYISKYKKLSDIDLFYSNSVIQYFENILDFTEIIKYLKPKYILLDDLYAGDNKEFISNQLNYDKKIPHRFYNKNNFHKLIYNLGYNLILEQPFNTPIRGKYEPKPMDNFPKEYRLRYSLTVLYQR